MRLDVLVSSRLEISRNKASEKIKNGEILLNQKVCTKPSFEVNCEDEILLIGEIYVSRSAKKLKDFLNEVKFDVSGLNCLDIGASTGGFTQILLENNALKITCVDVGSNQLHSSLRGNKRIEFYENTDIKNFKSSQIFDLVVVDLSFTSTTSLIPIISQFIHKTAIILFKPQFEVGIHTKRDKFGVVKDEKAINLSIKNFKNSLNEFEILHFLPSSIKGKNGNQEYLAMIKRRENG